MAQEQQLRRHEENKEALLFAAFTCHSPDQAVSHILTHVTDLDMAATAIAQVSKVEGQGIRPHSPFHNKAEVSLVSAPRPAHVRVVVDELFSGQKHTGTKGEKDAHAIRAAYTWRMFKVPIHKH